MTIDPKFKVNDFVQHKIQFKSSMKAISDMKTVIKFFEVLYIHTETCSAGTQIFYRVRAFYPNPTGYKDDKAISSIEFSITTQFTTEGIYEFREDELKLMTEEEKTFYGLIS